MSTSLNSWHEKDKGNEAFKAGDYQLAIKHYSAAIHNDIDPGDPLYFTNRAQAYLKLKEYPHAEQDCISALSLDPRLSKAYWRRALAHKELGTKESVTAAIADFRQWNECAEAEGKADQATKATMESNVRECEILLQSGKLPHATPVASSPSKSKPSPAPSSPVGQPHPSLEPHLDKIYSAHRALVQVWEEKGPQIICFWKEMVIPDVREAKLAAVLQRVERTLCPELAPSTLATSDNLLDFLSSRSSATHDPAHFGYHLDLPRVQLLLAQTTSTSSSRGSRTTTSLGVDERADYLILLPTSYGRVQFVERGDTKQLETRRKLMERGEACAWEEGQRMLLRQVGVYALALELGQALAREADAEGEEVNEEVVKEYVGQVKSKEFVGREEYSLERVTMLVRSAHAYAEDHLEFLREDADYVAEHLLDRMPSSVPSNATDLVASLGKEELLEMFLNGYARQTLWREVLHTITLVRALAPPTLSPGLPLPRAYQGKIGLLAKLVEAFINLTFKELCGSVEKCFGAVEGAGRDDGRGGEQGFYALLDLVAQMTGYVLPPSSRRSAARPNDRRQTPTSTSTAADPLASMFHALIQLDPQRMPTRTWEIVACLHELQTLFTSNPSYKSRLSRRLVEGLGEYTEAIELRELLLDSHRPRFSRDRSDRSHFLTQLGPLWQHLERSWTRAIHPAHIATFLRSKSAPSLGTIWARFEGEVQRQMGGEEVEGLFGKLLSGQGEKVVREQDGEEEEDGPPPLLEGSADESDASSGPPSLYAAHSEEEEEEDDSDVPPPLYAYANSTSDSDSDSDGPPPLTRAPARPSPPPTARRPTLPTRRPPRPRPATRAHHLPSSSTSAEPQPGPSHSARRPEVDMSGLRPDHEFGVRRDGVRSDEVGEAEEQQEGRRREKRKTRKAGGDGGSSTTGGETETETETETESETEGAAGGRRRGFAEDASFQVSRKVYATFEQYIGIGAHISRTEVPWLDLLSAMRAIGFHPVKGGGGGSSWKFYPTERIRGCMPISFHEPHPDSKQRLHQVSWIGKRLKKIGLRMDMLVIK